MVTAVGESNDVPRQSAVYRKYLGLRSLADQQFHGSLGGKLLLCAGFGMEGAEPALATTIAGGAFLGIEPDPLMLKTAVRNGSCDFMVNTLDEALRVLKNELRQKKPLSVGLLGDAIEIFPAMIERGVQPDLVADIAPLESPLNSAPAENSKATTEAHRQAVLHFMEQGAIALVDLADDSRQLEVVWTTANLPDMRSLDRAALGWLAPDDQLRRRWLEQASGFFYRQLPQERVLGVRSEELASLLEVFQSVSPLQAPATVRWRSPDGKLQSSTL